MAVHYIAVEHLRSGGGHGGDLFAQAREVRSENRGDNLSHKPNRKS
jgi:hypothetical protein